MQGENRNIYQTARKAAGYTQEAAAELLDLSVESIRAYETGIRVPGNDTVERMVEVYNTQHLAYQHLKTTNALMSRVVPTLEQRDFSQAAIRMKNRVNRFFKADVADRLLELADDGKISDDERDEYEELVGMIRDLVAVLLEVDLVDIRKEANGSGVVK